MAVAAGLGITLVPVLMGYFVRGKIPDEQANPLNRWLIAAYHPVLQKVLSFPKTTLLISGALLLLTLFPLSRLGSEFMPPLDEGICCICRRPCPVSPPGKQHGYCSRPTG